MFLEYVGILHQEERSGRVYRNTWTIWTACQHNSDVSSTQFIINSRPTEENCHNSLILPSIDLILLLRS